MIAVIGSNSFSGSHFINYCLKQGYDVVGISRSPEPDPVFLPYKKRTGSGFRFYQLDLNHDIDSYIEVLRQFRPSILVNFAAQSMVGESWQQPAHWFRTNVESTVRLHDALRHFRFLKKYVHISTPEVYGNCTGLVKESTCYDPSTPYAVSRAAADMSLMSFFRTYDFPVCFTRAANVYGPGQQLYRIIPKTVLYFLSHRKLPLHGGGQSTRSFIHIRDVADGTLKVAEKGRPGEIYHFATQHNISIRELVKMVAEQLDLSFEDHVEITRDRLGKDSAYLLDSTKARETLGWQDTIRLEEGISEIIQWISDHFDVLMKQPDYYIHTE